ncbi:hypothetical protein [Anatilimnocola aggregata]|nr:hypothetical protein [Anatilimnocola aggregata]
MGEYTPRPRNWPWSTFHRWVELGHHDNDSGAAYEPPDLPGDAGE